MKCQFCGYFHGWNDEKLEHEEGDRGDFYKLPIMIEREGDYMKDVDREKVYACPKCKTVFLGE